MHETQTMDPLNVALIGTGNISEAYIKGCRAFDALNLVACADLNLDKARSVAAKYEIPQVKTVEALLADPAIDLVINLTVPLAHAEVSLAVIASGKHLYSEKPLAAAFDDAQRIVKAAAEAGVRIGCAPDTFMFAPHQRCRQLIDAGAIGQPVAAIGCMASRGPESWHPNPDFFYQPGGGPMLDMGPYYITALVHLLGPAARVTGSARSSFSERIAGDGHRIPVNVATHVTGTIEFQSGVIATLIISFDVAGHRLPLMEIYGSESTLAVPDPNGFEADVKTYDPATKTWVTHDLLHPPEWARGIGVADMAYGIMTGRPHRASGELALHVTEIMFAFEEAARSGRRIDLTTTCQRPKALPIGLPPRTLDYE